MVYKLGIIGVSEGNGHPYSWSAIFNGYDPMKMASCGYPAIPQYLAEQKWPEAQIPNAQVTHIWTQNSTLSKKIASASLIEQIVRNPEDMIGKVDAVLLARDDAEEHYCLAKPFLEAGVPIYIDKPIALAVQDLERLYSLEKFPGQIFTCSALRYCAELSLSVADRREIGPIREIHAITPKGWDKYAIHVIEPVLKLLDPDDKVVEIERAMAMDAGGSIAVKWASGIVTRFSAVGEVTAAPLAIRVLGATGWRDLTFSDSFSAFKAALQCFVRGISEHTVESPPDFNGIVVSLIAAGRNG